MNCRMLTDGRNPDCSKFWPAGAALGVRSKALDVTFEGL